MLPLNRRLLRVELRERLSQLVADDSLVINFQPLEERLVEQPPLMRAGLPVGGLNIGDQRQRGVKSVQHLVVPDVELLHALGGADPLPADPGLLLSEQGLTHLIGVVGLEQLALLGVNLRQLDLGGGNLLIRQLGDHRHVSAH